MAHPRASAPKPPLGPSPATSKKAVFSLVLGVLSFCLSFLAGVPAVLLGLRSLRDIKQSRGTVGGRGLAIGGIALAAGASLLSCVGYLYLGLTLGVTSARDATYRLDASANLRQIGLALHGYHERNNAFPEAQKNGLSWRVWVLPDLGEKELFEQFRTEERWDSPHNQRLVAKMPKVFHDRRFPEPAAGHTFFRGVIGPNTVLGTAGTTLNSISTANGTTNTIVVVEAGDPVPWTKPDEYLYKPGQPLPPLGGRKGDRFLALFADGNVMFLRVDLPPKTFHCLFDWTNTEAFSVPE